MHKILLFICLPFFAFSQNKISEKLFSNYENYKEKSLSQRRIKHADLQPLLQNLKNNSNGTITVLGKSIEGRKISMISFGKGPTSILLWSQMHGDESTATMAIFDIVNYINKHPKILENTTVHFIPMLNPDGAEKFQRRNAIGIDINRDALQLQSPESRILKRVRDSLQADFGFNLHDQSKYYNAERTNKPATISYLAPAYNYEKSINETRSNAMKIIVQMNGIIQKYAPGQVGRYNDDFEPRAFGDNIQKWGTSTILIESGGYQNDAEKQYIRKLNFVSILAAINSISTKNYLQTNREDYFNIPKNDRKLFDLKITNLSFQYLNQTFKVDVGINHIEKDNQEHNQFFYIGKIQEIGDLSTYYGYENLDANNLQYQVGQTYPKIISNTEELAKFDFADLLKRGYTSIALDQIDPQMKYSDYPINIISTKNMEIVLQTKPSAPIKLGNNASFLLRDNNGVQYAIINGFVYNLQTNTNHIKNGLVK